MVEDVSDSVAQVGGGCCVGADGIGCLFGGGDVVGGGGVFGGWAKGKAFGEEVNLGLGEGDGGLVVQPAVLGGGCGEVGGLGVMRRASFLFWRSLVARWAESAWRRSWAVRLVHSWAGRVAARVASSCWWVA